MESALKTHSTNVQLWVAKLRIVGRALMAGEGGDRTAAEELEGVCEEALKHVPGEVGPLVIHPNHALLHDAALFLSAKDK